MSGILVYALHYEGAFNKNSLGAVSEGARLAGELGTECHAIVVGEGVGDDLAASLGGYGASKVFRVEGPEGLAQPVVDAMAKVATDSGRVGSDGSRTQVLAINPPPEKQAGEIIEDEDTDETVQRIVSWLEERKLLA